MAKKSCTVAKACPVIQVHCTEKLSAKKKCYVQVGKTKIKTKDQSGTGVKVGKLVQAQKRLRCVPLVKSQRAKAPRKPATGFKALKASLKQVTAEANARRARLKAEYRASKA